MKRGPSGKLRRKREVLARTALNCETLYSIRGTVGYIDILPAWLMLRASSCTLPKINAIFHILHTYFDIRVLVCLYIAIH